MSTLTRPKEVSTCCDARAKVDMTAGDDGTHFYFCTKCGQPCDVKNFRQPQRSTLSTVRKPTGERDLFVQLWAKCKGRSEVSGDKLMPPEHRSFHFQGSHLLPKGTYPDYRLDPRNIVMMTENEHATWHREPKGLLMIDPRWEPIVKRYQKLKEEAEAKNLSPKN